MQLLENFEEVECPVTFNHTFRPMTVADRELRQEALSRNLAKEDRQIDERYRQYLEFIPQRGDWGIVAEVDGVVAAVAWASFIDGLGGIPAENPELVTSVTPGFEGQRLGTKVMEQVIEYGQSVGWPGLAIFIDERNPARRVYARRGFESQAVPGAMLLPLTRTIRAAAVYCGAGAGNRPEYAEAARELGEALAEQGITLVYGGGNIGLMGAVADGVIAAGGTTVGVMPQHLVDKEMAHNGLDTLEIVDTMAERKLRMEELADCFIALPGGTGTLEEVFEAFTLQQLVAGTGPIVFYNVTGYWTPLVEALGRMAEEGFILQKYIDAIIVVDEPRALFEALDSWRAPGTKWAEFKG